MPYVLKHQTTGELYACEQINIYDFPYHGVKAWEDLESAKREAASFVAGQGVNEPWRWEIVELSEDRVKICNVKLNNDPAKRVYLTEEGRIEARRDA